MRGASPHFACGHRCCCCRFVCMPPRPTAHRTSGASRGRMYARGFGLKFPGPCERCVSAVRTLVEAVELGGAGGALGSGGACRQRHSTTMASTGELAEAPLPLPALVVTSGGGSSVRPRSSSCERSGSGVDKGSLPISWQTGKLREHYGVLRIEPLSGGGGASSMFWATCPVRLLATMAALSCVHVCINTLKRDTRWDIPGTRL